MSGVQRGLVYLIVPAVLAVLSFAVVGQNLPSSTLLATANAPLFMSTALAISVLAFRRGGVGRLLLLGAAISGVLAVLFAMCGSELRNSWMLAALGFWFAALLASGHRIARATGGMRLLECDRILVILSLPLAVLLTLTGLWLAAQVVPSTYDNYFYVFDGLLPFAVARAVAQFCATHRWAWDSCTIVYNDFLLVLCVFVVLRWRHDGEGAGQLLSRWVVATLAGYMLYYFLPGVGPDVAFYGASQSYLGSLPAAPEQVELTTLSGFAGWPRNAMPSLHTAWALLIALVSIDMSIRARVFAALYAVGTVIATLGLREHYLIDLIVALPFTVAVHAGMGLFEQKGNRRAQLVAALGSAAMTVGWLLVIRYGTASLRGVPSVASGLVLATIGASAWLIFRSEMERRASLQGVPDILASTASRA